MNLFLSLSSLRGRKPATRERRLQVILLQAGQVPTFDGVSVNVQVLVTWRARQAADASQSLADLREVVSAAAHQCLTRSIRSIGFAGLLTQRAEIGEQLRDAIGRQLASWGVLISQVEVISVMPDLDVEAQSEITLLRAMMLRLGQHRLHRAAAAIADQLASPPST